MTDPWQDPSVKRFAREVQRGLVPKMQASAAAMSIWTGKVDVKLAVEVGFALLLGKPFILAVEPGAKVPAGLARAADAIVEVDFKNPDKYAARLKAAVEQVLHDLEQE